MPSVFPAALRRLPVAVILVAVAALVATVVPAGIASAAPTSTAPARIAIDGTYNARTFANYSTDDGRSLNDRVVRSADLQNLSNRGIGTLRAQKVRTIVDLRTDVERMLKPNRPVPGTKTVIADVMALAPLAGSADFPGMYRTFVDNPGARQAYRTMLKSTLSTISSDNRVVVHCSAGRDRTGWAAAIMLRIAGAPMSVVESDFAAGDMGVDVAWLRGAFAHAKAVYGSFDAYVTKGLRFSTADQQRLRDALTE